MKTPSKQADQKTPSKLNHWKWFYDRWKGHGLFCLFLIFLTALSTIVAVATPLFFKYIIDKLSTSMTDPSIGETIALRNRFLWILLGIGMFRFFAEWYPAFRAMMNSILERSIRLEYFDYILRKDHHFFNKFRTGDIVTRLTDDLSGYPKVGWFGCSGFFRALNSTSIVICCLLVMGWLNWKLALIAIIPLPLAIGIYVKISKTLTSAYDENRKIISDSSNHLESSFSGIRVLKGYNAEKQEHERYLSILSQRFDKEMVVVKLSGSLHTFFQFVSHAAQVMVIIGGGIMAINGTLSLGDYYAFFTYLGFIVYPMLDLPNLLVTSRQAFVCVDRLEEIKNFGTEFEHSPDEVKKTKVLNEPVHNISFNSVSFSYNKDSADILSNLTLSINKGERIAILGQVGAGKSTLLNLLAGLIKPTSGTITVNDISISDLNPQDFRSRLGYIGQEAVVFSETIAQNIRFWRDHGLSDIEKAAKKAQFAHEIEEFTDGFEQSVGQRGVTISGGQKQRLTIARAVIGKPEILVMDDVTASLDADSEEAFWNDMDKDHDSSTVIIVTHRLATARRADRIVMLNKGMIEAQGTFDELAEKSEHFRRMVNIV